MEVRITSRNGQISQRQETWIRNRLSRMSRFFRSAQPARVVVRKASDKRIVELSFAAPRGVTLNARGEADNLRDAVSRAQARLERRLRKLKDRITSRRTAQRVTA